MAVNSAGAGNVAGIGVGPQGEPGVKLARLKKYINKNKQETPWLKLPLMRRNLTK